MSNVIYAGARAKSLYKGLLGAERINAMTESVNAEAALGILSEAGFISASFDGATDYESILSAAKTELFDFIREACPSEALKKYLLYKNDFHNAEAFIKAKFLKLDGGELACESGTLSASVLKERIFVDDYRSFPKAMAQALSQCDEAFVSGTATGVAINGLMEKAYFSALFEACKKDKLLTRLCHYKADAANVKIAIRSRDYKYAEKQFVKGGELGDAELRALCEETPDTIKEKFKFSYIGKEIAAAADALEKNASLSEFEKLTDDYPLKLLLINKYSTEGYYPFIIYCLYKLADIANVRIILSGLYNGESRQDIENRLRLYYEG